MNRRNWLKNAALASAAVASGFRLPLALASGYAGKLFVSIQADGGWDPTSFCDPKMNTLGEPVINHWAQTKETQQAGNIAYAPFAKNDAFFKKYHDRMLVINGVDAQTNSHTVGVVHNWSGRNAEGYPSLAALLASRFGAEMPVGYLSFGGFADTGGLTRYTRIDRANLLRNIAAPDMAFDGDEISRIFSETTWQAMQSRRVSSTQALLSRETLLPSERKRADALHVAMTNSHGLKAYADAIPPENELEQTINYQVGGAQFWSSLRKQAQLAVLAFKTEVAVSADLHMWGFDTHEQHDAQHEWLLGELTDGIDYLWEYAEKHGVADRLVVLVGSDFGRTNFYNSQSGKDHWPIGSFIVMEKNQSWTNQVLGETDGLHFAHKINSVTLKRDDTNGTIIYPKHVHKAMRDYLALGDSHGAQRYPFNNTEDFAFFA